MSDNEKIPFEILIKMAAEIVASYVSNNSVAVDALPGLVQSTFTTLQMLDSANGPDSLLELKPAVSIRRSIQPDFIVCLEDGKKLKMLKRYLRTQYNLSPEDYRRKWRLPADYPMVAPNYSKQRSNFAKTIGLGQKSNSQRTSR